MRQAHLPQRLNTLFFVIPLIFLLIGCIPSNKNNQDSEETLPSLEVSSQTETVLEVPPGLPENGTFQTGRTLEKHWNLVSFPVTEVTSLTILMESDTQYMNIRSVWQWDLTLDTHGGWRVYPQTDDFPLLSEVEPNTGYWINAKNEFDLTGDGVNANTYSLSDGWNLIGYSHSADKTTLDDLWTDSVTWATNCQFDPPIVSVWAWDDLTWKVYFPDDSARTAFNTQHGTHFEPLMDLEPGQGVWVKTNKAYSQPTDPCNNESPTDLALDTTNIAENQASGTTIGMLSATDSDTGDTFRFSLVSGAGDEDNSSFEIDGSALRTMTSFDYETKSIYFLRVQVKDAAGGHFEKAITVTVDDATEGPVVATDLIFSEYIEGSSNNKAIEIYNGTDSAIDLATGQYVVQAFNNGSTTATNTETLTGTIAAGDVFVIAHASADQTILDAADITSSVTFFNGDDALILYKGGAGGTLVDSLGQLGNDPGSEWGSGDQSTANNTLRRVISVCEGDTIVDNTFDPATEWDGYAQNTFDGLGAHTMNCDPVDVAPTLASSTPSDSGIDALPWKAIEITFSEKVVLGENWYAINCTTSGAHTATVAVDGKMVTIAPETDFARAESCTVTVTAAQITDQDAALTPMAADVQFTFTTLGNLTCSDSATAIHDIQGTDDTNAKDGETVEIEGIVIGDFQGNDKQSGFFIQELDDNKDTDDSTSEGIFVYDNTFGYDVTVGAAVRVRGVVDENFGQTQLESISNITPCVTFGFVTPTTVTLPVPDASYLERYEGMLVTFTQKLYVSELYHLGRGGQVTLSSTARLPQPTNIVAPGSEATDQAMANAFNLIYLDDGSFDQNLDPAYPGSGLTADNTLRGGDSTTGLTGVLSYSWAGYSSSSTTGYRVHPTDTVTFVEENPRPSLPDVGGSLKVASFNVLNYFNGDGNGNDIGDGRGADDLEEFLRQRAKIIAALDEMEADIIGLMELENDYADGHLSAIHDLVTGLNTESSDNYAYVDPGANIGSDEIAVGLIYNTKTVSLVGDHQILDDSVNTTFYESKNRPVLAQTFMQKSTSGKLTVAVNHFKSKGSDCDTDPITDPDTGDGQGNCNLTRLSAANAEISWLTNDPTNSGDTDVLVIGDLNSYAKEDPIKAFTDSGYTDLVNKYEGDDAYSYVFGGRWGYLDHALSSTSLTSQVTGTAVWHINADEPPVLDYNTSFKSTSQQSFLYNDGPYRSSDHDPVIIGLDLAQ